MKKNSVVLSFLLLMQLPFFAQQQEKTQSLFKRNNWLDFVTIRIDRYENSAPKRYEVDVVYLKDSSFKIHAVVHSIDTVQKKIDTVLTLNAVQLVVLEHFYDAFQKNSFPAPKEIITRSREKISCTMDGDTIAVETETYYSLIEELLKE